MPKTEAQKRAEKKYNKNCKRLIVMLYPTEQDIMEKINSVDNYSGYIKGLIRDDIARNK